MRDIYRRLFEFSAGGELHKPEVLIEPTHGRQLRIQFGIRNIPGNFFSYADIALYNLSDETANKISKPGNLIALKAGYEGNLALIFVGDLMNMIREREGPDTITRIIAKSEAMKLRALTLDKSFGPGVKAYELIEACAGALGIPVTIHDKDRFSTVLPRGYALHGAVKQTLMELAKQFKFKWLVDMGRLVIVPDIVGYRRPGMTHLVGMETGMVGNPEFNVTPTIKDTESGKVTHGREVGATVAVRLNPQIKWSDSFVINARYVRAHLSSVYFGQIPENAGQGTFSIQTLEHQGDSYGDIWDTRLYGLNSIITG